MSSLVEPPEERQRHPLLLLAPATFFEGYDLLVLSLVLPLIRSQFHLTVEQSGFLVSMVFAGSFGAFILLPLADRFGRKPLLMTTILGYTVATFLTAFTRGMVGFVVCQFVARLFMSAEIMLATIVLVETTESERRGKAFGLLSSMSALGQAAAGAGFLFILTFRASWRVLYLIAVAPLLLFAYARRHLEETGRRDVTQRVLLRQLSRRWFFGAALLSLFIAIYPAAVTTLASTLVLDEWKLNLAGIQPWYFGVWLLAVTGFFVAGRMMDWLGRRPTSIIFFTATALAGLTAFTATTTPGRAIGLGLVVFTITGSTPCLSAYSTELFPNGLRGTAGAVLQVMSITGAAIAPALTTSLSVPLGSLSRSLSVIGISYLFGAATVLLLLPETRSLVEGALPSTGQDASPPNEMSPDSPHHEGL